MITHIHIILILSELSIQCVEREDMKPTYSVQTKSLAIERKHQG